MYISYYIKPFPIYENLGVKYYKLQIINFLKLYTQVLLFSRN